MARRTWPFALILLVTLTAVPTSSPAAEPSCPEIHIGGATQRYPYALRDGEDGTAFGVAYELAQWIGDEISVPVTFHAPVPWSRAETEFDHGEIDMIAGVYGGKERWQGRGILSLPIAEDYVSIFVREDNQFNFKTPEDLIGRTGASLSRVKWGDAFERVRPQLAIEEVAKHAQVLHMIQKRRVDYGIMPLFNGNYWISMIEGGETLTALPTPIAVNSIHLIMSSQSPCLHLMAQVNEMILRSKENGVLQEITRRNTAVPEDPAS